MTQCIVVVLNCATRL